MHFLKNNYLSSVMMMQKWQKTGEYIFFLWYNSAFRICFITVWGANFFKNICNILLCLFPGGSAISPRPAMLTRPGRTGEVTAARGSGLIHLFRHTTDSSTRSRNRMSSRPIRSIYLATRRVSRPAGRSLSTSTPSPTWSRTRRGNLHRRPKILQIRIPLPVKQVCNH